MKKPLLLNGQENDFFEPYYIYDTVSVYDKIADKYVSRRRSVAISISAIGEIAIASTICSAQDNFVKKTARSKLGARLRSALLGFFGTERTNAGIYSNSEGSHVFSDYATYNSFCNSVDSLGNQYFLPYRVQVAETTAGKTKSYDVTRKSASDIYLHRRFLAVIYPKFMGKVEECNEKAFNLDTGTVVVNGLVEQEEQLSAPFEGR